MGSRGQGKNILSLTWLQAKPGPRKRIPLIPEFAPRSGHKIPPIPSRLESSSLPRKKPIKSAFSSVCCSFSPTWSQPPSWDFSFPCEVCCMVWLCGIPEQPITRIPLGAELLYLHWGDLPLPEWSCNTSVEDSAQLRCCGPTLPEVVALFRGCLCFPRFRGSPLGCSWWSQWGLLGTPCIKMQPLWVFWEKSGSLMCSQLRSLPILQKQWPLSWLLSQQVCQW